MPGLASYGQAGDYSYIFTSLAQRDFNNNQAEASAADNRRLTNLAAKDAETFDLYNAGKLKGGDAAILAYIAKRKAETGYDPKQHEQWVKAQLDYTKSINDGQAEAAYAAGGSIWHLVDYYRSQMLGVSKNSPEYRTLAQKVRDLTDQGVGKDVQRGAERIVANINAGKATLKDLLTFYQSHLGTARPGSDIRSQITKAITDTRQKLVTQTFETNMAKVYQDLNTKSLTPQQAGQKIRSLLDASPLKTADPTRYYSILADATKLTQTVDDQSQIAQIRYQLAAGQITPAQAEQQFYAEADKYKTIDPTTYYNLRMEGLKAATADGNALPNPGALDGIYGPGGSSLPGLPTYTPPGYTGPTGTNPLNTVANGSRSYVGNLDTVGYGPANGPFKWVSQLDGTEFASINCAAASTAMLAYVMGVTGLSGGDIRAMSGDTSGGITLAQDQQILKRLGIKGLENTMANPVDFAAFKQRMQQGSPALVSGIYGNVPANLRVAPNLTGTHQMMIASYDPKKDAFLVYDPAVSQRTHPNYKGEWWPSAAIKNFGWGPSLNGDTRYGEVLFTPANTIKPGQITANFVRHISVDTPPQLPGTPKSYVGMNNPGPSGQAPGLHPSVTSGGNTKPNNDYTAPAGMERRPTTDTEAQKLLDQNQSRIDTITSMTDAYARGDTSIKIGGTTFALDEATVTALHQEVLWRTDHEIALSEAMGNMDVSQKLRDTRANFITSVKAANTIPVERLWNTLVRDVTKDLSLAQLENDPARAYLDIQKAEGKLTAFQQQQQKVNTSGELSGVDVAGTQADLQGKIDATINALKIATDKDQPSADKTQQIADIANVTGIPKTDPGLGLVGQISDMTSGIGSVERGESTMVIVNGQTIPVPVRQIASFDAQGNPISQSVADIGSIVKGATATNLVSVPMDGPTGPTTMLALPTDIPVGNMLRYTKNDPATGAVKGQYLTAADLQDTKKLGALIAAGLVEKFPYTVRGITMPDRIVVGPKRQIIVKGQTWAEDPGTGAWSPVNSDGTLPFIDHRGAGVPGAPDIIAWNPVANGPDIGFKAPDTSYSAPYEGKNTKAVQDAANTGSISLLPTLTRGIDGEVSPTPPAVGLDIPAPLRPMGDAPSEAFGARRDLSIAGQNAVDASQQVPGVAPNDLAYGAPSTGPTDKLIGAIDKTFTPPNPNNPMGNSEHDLLAPLTNIANGIGITVPSPTPTPPTPAPRMIIPPAPTGSTRRAPSTSLPKITVASPTHPYSRNVVNLDMVDPGTPAKKPSKPYVPPPPSTPGTSHGPTQRGEL